MLLLVVLEGELVGPLDVFSNAVKAEEELVLADLTPGQGVRIQESININRFNFVDGVKRNKPEEKNILGQTTRDGTGIPD
jgi:hypothetical protein